MYRIIITREYLTLDLFQVKIVHDKCRINIIVDITPQEAEESDIILPKENIFSIVELEEHLSDWLLKRKMSKWVLRFCLNNYKYILT